MTDRHADIYDKQRQIKLRAMTDQILSVPVGDRLRQIEEEANFFSTTKPV